MQRLRGLRGNNARLLLEKLNNFCAKSTTGTVFARELQKAVSVFP
jgi:hypothetical protein